MIHFFLFFLVVLFSGVGEGKVRALKVTTFDYPPYMIEKTSDGLPGIDIEIIQALLPVSEWKIVYRYLPMRRAVSEIKITKPANAIHMGTSMQFAQEIRSGLYKQVKIGSAKFVTYVREANWKEWPKVMTVGELVGKKVAVLRGSSVVPMLKAENIEILEVGSFEQLFKVLNLHRVDASVVLELSGDNYLLKHSSDGIRKLRGTIGLIPMDIIIPQSHPHAEEIFATLSARVVQIKQNGQISKILEKYGLTKESIANFLADF